MKKFWIILVLAFSASVLPAQLYVNGIKLTNENSGTYITVRPLAILGQQLRAVVDYGQLQRPFYREEVTDPDGKPLFFNSETDILNYFTELGWQLDKVYTTGESNGTVNYILKRE